jgi:hypothetical protein
MSCCGRRLFSVRRSSRPHRLRYIRPSDDGRSRRPGRFGLIPQIVGNREASKWDLDPATEARHLTHRCHHPYQRRIPEPRPELCRASIMGHRNRKPNGDEVEMSRRSPTACCDQRTDCLGTETQCITTEIDGNSIIMPNACLGGFS